MPPVTGSSPRFRDTARKSHDNGCEGPCVASWFHYALCLLIKMSRFSWPHGRAPQKRAEHTRGLSVLGSKTKINLKHAQGRGGGRGALPTPRQSHRGRPAPVPRDPQLPTASRQALRALSSVCRVPDLQPLTKTQPPGGRPGLDHPRELGAVSVPRRCASPDTWPTVQSVGPPPSPSSKCHSSRPKGSEPFLRAQSFHSINRNQMSN